MANKMVNKTDIGRQPAGAADDIDPVYSIAENVRQVASEAGETAAVTKRAVKKIVPARTKKAESSTVVVSKGKQKKEKAKSENKNTPSRAALEETGAAEDEFIEIKPGFFWKLATVVLALLVIWSYFFR